MKDPYVISDAVDSYYIAYHGSSSAGSISQVGCATTTNPNGPWTKCSGNPIVARTASTDHHQVMNPELIKDLTEPDSTKRWKILYSGRTSANYGRIFLRTCAGPPDTCTWSSATQVLDGGPADATIVASPNGISRASNVVTVTTTAAHGLTAGAKVDVRPTTDCSTAVTGQWFIASTPTSTTFTFAQTGPDQTNCGGGGTAEQFDSDGYWRTRSVFYSGNWYLFTSAKALTEPSSPFRISYSRGGYLTDQVKSFAVLVDVKADAQEVVTANVSGTRTISMSSTTGFVADQYCIIDEDTTNSAYGTFRIRKVNAGSSLESYQRLDGWTSASSPRVRCIDSFPRIEVSDVDVISPGNFFLYVTSFCPFCDQTSPTEDAFAEQSGLLKSSVFLSGYTWDHLNSPVGHRTESGHDYSHENIVLQKAPTQPPSRPRVGRW